MKFLVMILMIKIICSKIVVKRSKSEKNTQFLTTLRSKILHCVFQVSATTILQILRLLHKILDISMYTLSTKRRPKRPSFHIQKCYKKALLNSRSKCSICSKRCFFE